jgi:hypothetical protein
MRLALRVVGTRASQYQKGDDWQMRYAAVFQLNQGD